ncbi:hypothetical protein QF048_000266 [Streptomyces sp. W4I9-2]|nr:hypothetical protein [Streptomyces sp. W4I9-2]
MRWNTHRKLVKRVQATVRDLRIPPLDPTDPLGNLVAVFEERLGYQDLRERLPSVQCEISAAQSTTSSLCCRVAPAHPSALTCDQIAFTFPLRVRHCSVATPARTSLTTSSASEAVTGRWAKSTR